MVWALVIILLLPIVSGVEPQFFLAKNKKADLNFACFQPNGAFCEASYNCTVTVQYPNSSLLLNDAPTTRQTRYYNITLPDTSVIGVYAYQSYCTNGTESGYSPELYYEINISGEEITTAKGLLYLVVLGLTSGLFVLCLYFALKLPSKNETTMDGIVNVNDLKYLRLFLWFVVYILALFMSFLAEGVSSFLQVGVASALFNITTIFLAVFIMPVFVIVFVSGIMRYFSDKEIKKLNIRNLKPR